MVALGRLLRGDQQYADPAGRYVAAYAAPWRRVAAGAIDWTLCYVAFLLVSIPLGALQALGSVSWREGDFGGLPGEVLFVATQVLTVVPVIAYFALLLPTSQTLGMNVLELRAISTRTGRAPSYVTATVRGVVATAIAGSFYATYSVATSFDEGQELDPTSSHVLDAAHVLVVVGCVSALTMMLVTTRRSLLDRLFGTAVIDELEAVTPRMGPWGPLDTFDLSTRPRSTARH